jgi:pyruvate, water dikinase
MNKKKALILWFNKLGIEHVPLVGGKNASLGEMYRNLNKKGVRIPNGFAVTAHAYRYLLDKAGIKKEIKRILKDLDTHNMHNLAERGSKVRNLIRSAPLPEDLVEEIKKAYQKMCKEYGKDTDVAVRSSATAEDLPDASFAGQQETYLNVRGEQALLEACRNCFASLFTNRAISYREDKGFNHFSIALSIGVQKMVRSDIACSGVMFSIDTESGYKDAAFITGAYGLGETIVQGSVNPDEYYVHKPTLKLGFNSIISRQLGEKAKMMVYTKKNGKAATKTIPVPEKKRKQFVLTEKELLTLAKWACIIEDHYSKKARKFKPMDMEWAKDGKTKELFIVQARPETVMSQKDFTQLEEYRLKQKGKLLCTGHSVGQKIGQGKANIIQSAKSIHTFKKGEVLVTDMTDPDWEPIMKIASAIVTNKGSRTCHAAIISRELGIPCVVGTVDGTKTIPNKHPVTVSCSEGDEGRVYNGLLKFNISKHNLKHLPKPKTGIMLNLGNPEQAFELSHLPVTGIGLAREEFIINSFIKVHPKALIDYNKVKDKSIKKQIDKLTQGYTNKKEFFVDKLAQGVARIAAAFYPRPVILRFSDFKSNEYANLVGGKMYEPEEANPMMGWRGASRYYSEAYTEAFSLECEAIRKVRDEMGLTNLEVMVPICRTVAEGKKVLAMMKKYGLPKGKNGLKVMCMCEVPSNVILAKEFLEVFDGFSIGSNDLTQFTLAVDRDSELVADIYDERNEAVKKLIKHVVEIANKKRKYIGLCGQGPSDHLDFAEFLVRCGIQTMSLNADAVMKTIVTVAKMEKKVRR